MRGPSIPNRSPRSKRRSSSFKDGGIAEVPSVLTDADSTVAEHPLSGAAEDGDTNEAIRRMIEAAYT